MIKSETLGGVKMVKYKLVVEQDCDAMSPREWDNLGTMACWHTRYNLGDVQPDLSPVDYRSSLVADQFADRWFDDWGDVKDGQLEQIEKLFDKRFISLSLYLYDHSGITMNTGGFSCPWDSGQVGFIYVDRKDACEAMGWKRITKKREQQMLEYLRNEVATYDKYLTGDVYGGKLYKYLVAHEALDIVNAELDVDDLEETDSCWGFYGSNFVENGMLDNFGVTEAVCNIVTPW